MTYRRPARHCSTSTTKKHAVSTNSLSRFTPSARGLSDISMLGVRPNIFQMLSSRLNFRVGGVAVVSHALSPALCLVDLFHLRLYL
jgi:hypothetical protein